MIIPSLKFISSSVVTIGLNFHCIELRNGKNDESPAKHIKRKEYCLCSPMRQEALCFVLCIIILWVFYIICFEMKLRFLTGYGNPFLLKICCFGEA